MDRVSISQAEGVWRNLPPDVRKRFEIQVLGWGRFTPREIRTEYDRAEFMLLAVERWMTAVLPLLDESRRFYICQRLYGDPSQSSTDVSPFVVHVNALPADFSTMGEDEKLEGFFFTVFDGDYATWTDASGIIDLITYTELPALPGPSIWSTILAIPPLYFQLLATLRRLADVAHGPPGQECPPQDDPPE